MKKLIAYSSSRIWAMSRSSKVTLTVQGVSGVRSYQC